MARDAGVSVCVCVCVCGGGGGGGGEWGGGWSADDIYSTVDSG